MLSNFKILQQYMIITKIPGKLRSRGNIELAYLKRIILLTVLLLPTLSS